MRYLGNEVKEYAALYPGERAAGNVQGEVIDRLGFDQGMLVATCGAASGTPSTQSVTFKIQQGAKSDGSDAADIAAAKLATSSVELTADNTKSSLAFDMRALKRYLRLYVTTAFTGGSTPKLISQAIFILGFATTEPVS